MKKIIVIAALYFMILQSCHSQNFDLATVQFPLAKSSLDKYKLEDQQVLIGNYQLFKSSNPDLLYFHKIKLGGKNLENDSYSSTNLVTFYNEDKTNKIFGYRINVYTTTESKKLLNILTTKLGVSHYDYGKDDRFRIWESPDKKTIYLLEYRSATTSSSLHGESADLKVLDIATTDILNYNLGGGFGYYKDYLKVRAKKTSTYSYTDFLKDMKAEGESYFLKNNNIIK
ncbi:hypothetical protein [Pedobacter sp. L105]|uniref:hypothetical protein n=1 Tax=Pedobacter sp. L105 TaxID=1641871 RepID=UPI00131E38F5|nr:hypothetical protein [Pedobacter sp. L105]